MSHELHKPRTHLIFLGAGASIPLGFPGSVALAERFVESLHKLPSRNKVTFERKIRHFRHRIESNDFDFDSESLYSCLQGHSEPNKFLRHAGIFASVMAKVQPISNTRADLVSGQLRKRFEEFLIMKYYRDNPSLKKQLQIYYNRFFAKIIGSHDWENATPDWSRNSFDVFTTNYDYTLETYAELVGLRIFNGCIKAEHDRIIFNSDGYDQSQSPLKLYKLHGSVELSLVKNGDVVQELPPAVPGRGKGKNKVTSKVMVYGLEKNMIGEPHFELLMRFKNALKREKYCIVAGYSFRDPWITQIFRDVIKAKPELRISYIDPSPDEKLRKHRFLKNVTSPIPKGLHQWLDLPEQGEWTERD